MIRDTVELSDGEAKVQVELLAPMATLFIKPKGYGDSCSVDGSGIPIMLAVYRGKLWLTVWGDINQDDPTHRIDLEGAKESNRTQPQE